MNTNNNKHPTFFILHDKSLKALERRMKKLRFNRLHPGRHHCVHLNYQNSEDDYTPIMTIVFRTKNPEMAMKWEAEVTALFDKHRQP